MTALKVLLLIILVIAALVALIAAYFLWRMNRLYRQGAFLCSYRPDVTSGWTEGCAVYEAESLSWYKAAGLSFHPDKTWPRRQIELGKVHNYLSKKGIRNVAVPVTVGTHRFWLFLSEDDHAGLVSWAEAAPPREIPQSWG